jgi:hypothetical protein
MIYLPDFRQIVFKHRVRPDFFIFDPSSGNLFTSFHEQATCEQKTTCLGHLFSQHHSR